MKLTDKFTFGKHKGESLSHVIGSDPTYVEWCIDEIEGFSISDRAHDQLHYSLEEYYESKWSGFEGYLDYYDLCD